jgi:hypothetical protein
MVLTQTRDVNVTYEHHLVVILSKYGIVDHVFQSRVIRLSTKKSMGTAQTCEPLLVSLRHPHQRLRIPGRRTQQSFTVGILANALEDRTDCFC